jgi:hypothetical protein
MGRGGLNEADILYFHTRPWTVPAHAVTKQRLLNDQCRLTKLEHIDKVEKNDLVPEERVFESIRSFPPAATFFDCCSIH